LPPAWFFFSEENAAAIMNSRTDDALKAAAKCWDTTAEARASQPIQGWMDSAIVLETYVQPRITGDARTNWLIGLGQRLPTPRSGRWLSLGCGAAGQEIFAATHGLFGSMDAYDASPASVEQARKAAEQQGIGQITFQTADLNRIRLPERTYDVVMMNMSLHHVKQLRPLLTGIRRALKPGGILILNEFVGPRQFQFTDLQLGLVNELLQTLPASLRQDCTTGAPKETYLRLPVEHWNIADPSEAIRSDRILPEVQRQFRVIERIDYGGTILNLLLGHIVHNFDAANEKDVALIRVLAKFEEALIRHGVLPSDFTVILAEPAPGPQRLSRSLQRSVQRAWRAARTRWMRRA
jgi:ubiquinone/menaquinone biosynthesis C-methylase UbiE